MYTHTPGFVFARYCIGKSGLLWRTRKEKGGRFVCYTVNERNAGRTDERTSERAIYAPYKGKENMSHTKCQFSAWYHYYIYIYIYIYIIYSRYFFVFSHLFGTQGGTDPTFRIPNPPFLPSHLLWSDLALVLIMRNGTSEPTRK